MSLVLSAFICLPRFNDVPGEEKKMLPQYDDHAEEVCSLVQLFLQFIVSCGSKILCGDAVFNMVPNLMVVAC